MSTFGIEGFLEDGVHMMHAPHRPKSDEEMAAQQLRDKRTTAMQSWGLDAHNPAVIAMFEVEFATDQRVSLIDDAISVEIDD